MSNKDIQQRIKEYEAEIKTLETKHGVAPTVTIDFPRYKILPDEVLLALRIIETHGRIFMLSYSDLESEDK